MLGLVAPEKGASSTEVFGVSTSPNLKVPSDGMSFIMTSGRGLGRLLKHEVARVGASISMVDIVEDVKMESAQGRTKTQVVSAMSIDDLPHNEILRTQQLTSELREKIIEIVGPHFSDNELFNQLKEKNTISTDLGLNEFLRNNPASITLLHKDPLFSHLKGIIYDAGLNNEPMKVAVMFKFDAPEMRVVGKPNLLPVLPERVLSKDAVMAQNIALDNINSDNNPNLKMQ